LFLCAPPVNLTLSLILSSHRSRSTCFVRAWGSTEVEVEARGTAGSRDDLDSGPWGLESCLGVQPGVRDEGSQAGVDDDISRGSGRGIMLPGGARPRGRGRV